MNDERADLPPNPGFGLRGLEVGVQGARQGVPPRMPSSHGEIIVDNDEPGRWLERLRQNLRRHGTVCNTVAPGAEATGMLHRRIGP